MLLLLGRALNESIGYHSSYRENFTALHFQPRPDLLSDLNHLKAAKAPLVRKLVNTALTKSLGLRKEKLLGGVSKCTGRCGAFQAIVRVDSGSMLSQLGYTVTFKNPEDQSLIFVQIAYERLWDCPMGLRLHDRRKRAAKHRLLRGTGCPLG